MTTVAAVTRPPETLRRANIARSTSALRPTAASLRSYPRNAARAATAIAAASGTGEIGHDADQKGVPPSDRP